MAVKQLIVGNHISQNSGTNTYRIFDITLVSNNHAYTPEGIRFSRTYNDSDNIVSRVGIFRQGTYVYRIASESEIESVHKREIVQFIQTKLSSPNFVQGISMVHLEEINEIISSYL